MESLAGDRSPSPVAEVDGVSRTYGSAGRWTQALSDVSAAFHGGRVAAVAGPSGSGKSTLLRILCGLDVASDGDVTVCGLCVSSLGARARRRLRRALVSFLFQKPSDNLVSYLTAEQHLRMASGGRAGAVPPDEALALVGIAHAEGRRPHELSGGEQQRLAVAQALVAARPLLLLDEPTAELDEANGRQVVELLGAAAARGAAVVVASHDPVVVDAADDVVELADGSVRA